MDMNFNIFKTKPTLKELIPEGFVDIHSHILPDVDDGAKNIDESIKLINKMKKIGFSKMIGTPHSYPGLYDNTNDSIKNSYNLLSSNISSEFNIFYASEYMMDIEIVQKARKKELLCLKDNYVLVEMSYIAAPANIYEIIFEICLNDYVPVLAHPERYQFFHNNFREYYKLKKHGCLFQINLLSNTDYYGKNTLATTEKLLKRDLVDFVGSDIHSQTDLDYFEKKIGIREIKKLNEAINSNCFFD